MAGRILVVDDLADMCTLLGLTLRRNGWEVLEARNGEEAVMIARIEQPDLILMDYDMPKLNGLDACRLITCDAVTAHIPVVIYTGYSAVHVREEALEAGATSFLLKPITPTRLREEIEGILAR